MCGSKTQSRRVIKKPEKFTNIRECAFCCPYGEKGDRLWVRETYREIGQKGFVFYKADQSPTQQGPWRSPIYMPRWASRITLEITDVRVERIQEISEEDAKAEGDQNPFEGLTHVDGTPIQSSAILRFKSLWNVLNAKRGFSFESNPFCWVLEFRRIK